MTNVTIRPEVEHRLTALESQVTSLAVRSSAHGHDIGIIKDQIRADEAVSDAAASRWTNREKIIATVATIVLPVCAVISIFHI
jgi:hypothetical protein